MGFEEDVVEVIKQGLGARETKRQKDEDFSRGWEAKRSGTVKSVLDEAARAIRGQPPFQAAVERLNGSIDLVVVEHHNADKHCLVFEPDKKARMVSCRSSLKSFQRESFTLDGLHREAVEGRVKEFLLCWLSPSYTSLGPEGRGLSDPGGA